VHAHVAKVIAKVRLHGGARSGVDLLAGSCEHLVHIRWRGGRPAMGQGTLQRYFWQVAHRVTVALVRPYSPAPLDLAGCAKSTVDMFPSHGSGSQRDPRGDAIGLAFERIGRLAQPQHRTSASRAGIRPSHRQVR
jgi:hypothetical protein